MDLNPLREELEKLLPLIRQVADFVGRQWGVSPEERKDLVNDVCLRLAQNDYEKLRQFAGRAKIASYLKVVVANLAIDHLRHEKGKYRPSARSREIGDWACRYETLRRIEGRSRDEAVAILEREGFAVPAQELDRLDGEIASRQPPRSFETTDGLAELPSGNLNPEERVLLCERQKQRRGILLKLREAFRGLSKDDRSFLRLYCEPTARSRAKRLAAMFGLSTTEVYRRYQELCKDLRRRLRELGVDIEDVRSLLLAWQDEDEKA